MTELHEHLILDKNAQDLLFRDARTANTFSDEPVSEEQIAAIYDLVKYAPTSMNMQPLRILLVRTPEARERLVSHLMDGNKAKTSTAPLVAVLAYDPEFHEHLPTQFPAMPGARDMFHGNTGMIESTAFRNSSLQGAYLILAARALGLDAGPMSGFNNAAVDAAFFPEGKWKSNFLVNLGYGDASANWPRGPRLAFDTMVRIA